MSTANPWSPEWPGPLAANQVHIARLVMEEISSLLPLLEKTLAPVELDRAAAFYAQADRDRYVAARGGLRLLLARYMGVEPRRLQFEVNRFGKPMLSAETHTDDIAFNVSHAPPLIALVFARERAVGVDVELVDHDLPHFQLAQRFFSTDEVSVLRAASGEELVEAFFAIWTRKEAYMKGVGQGFSMPSREFTVGVDPEGARTVDVHSPGVGAESWWTIGLDVGQDCAGALAIEGEGWETRQFDAGELLSSDSVMRTFGL